MLRGSELPGTRKTFYFSFSLFFCSRTKVEQGILMCEELGPTIFFMQSGRGFEVCYSGYFNVSLAVLIGVGYGKLFRKCLRPVVRFFLYF